MRYHLLAALAVIGFTGSATAQWQPPSPYDQIPVIQDCSKTGGDIAVARVLPTGARVIYYCQAVADKINAAHPGAVHFFYVHEFGHHILDTSDEAAVDRWAARQLSTSRGGEDHLRAAIAHFTARGNEHHPRYGTMIQRAERIRAASGLRDDRERAREEICQPRLSIWQKSPGNTGMEAMIYVNGRRIGKISNLDEPERIDLGLLAKGVHTYELRNITGYRVGHMGEIGPVFLRGGWSSGSFRVQGDGLLRLSVRVDGGGLRSEIR